VDITSYFLLSIIKKVSIQSNAYPFL